MRADEEVGVGMGGQSADQRLRRLQSARERGGLQGNARGLPHIPGLDLVELPVGHPMQCRRCGIQGEGWMGAEMVPRGSH